MVSATIITKTPSTTAPQRAGAGRRFNSHVCFTSNPPRSIVVVFAVVMSYLLQFLIMTGVSAAAANPCLDPRKNGLCFRHLDDYDEDDAIVVDYNYTEAYIVKYGPTAPRSGAAPQFFSDAHDHAGMRFMSTTFDDTISRFHLQYLATDNENTTIAFHAGIAADNFALSHNADASTDYGQTLWAPAVRFGHNKNSTCRQIVPNALSSREAYDRREQAFCSVFKLCNVSSHVLQQPYNTDEEDGDEDKGSGPRFGSVYYHPLEVKLPDLITSLSEFINADTGEPIVEALCESGVYFSGVIASQRPFVRKPSYAFAAVFDGESALDNYFNDDTDAFSQDGVSILKNVTLSNVIGGLRSPLLGGSAQPAWRGNLAHTTLFNEVADYALLIGDYTNTTVTPPTEHDALIVTASIDTSSSVVGFANPPTNTDRGTPYISHDTTYAVKCSIDADSRAYSMTYIAPNTTGPAHPTDNTKYTDRYDCFSYSSLDAIQVACTDEDDCLGFTSSINEFGTEVPLCKIKASSRPPQKEMRLMYPRVFYEKPTSTQQSCMIETKLSGTMAIYLAQTTFAERNAIIFVDGDVYGYCGMSAPFVGGIRGSSGQCDEYNLCNNVPVKVGSFVQVLLTGAPNFNLCESSLSVLFSLTKIDAVQQTHVARPEFEIPNKGLYNRTKFVEVEAGTAVSIYAHKVTNVATLVPQSFYDCTINGGTNCPDHQLSLSTATATTAGITAAAAGQQQTCGGKKGFYHNQSGLSDRCYVEYWCGDAMSLVTANPSAANANAKPYYSGWLTLRASTQMKDRTSLCEKPSATLHASPADGRYPITFPFVASSVFVCLPYTTDETVARAAALQMLSSGNITVQPHLVEPIMGHRVGPAAKPLTPVFVDLKAMGARSTRDVSMMLNKTHTVMGCFVDSTTSAPECTFVVPHGATHVTIEAAQIGFDDTDRDLLVSVNRGNRKEQTYCGIDSGFGVYSGTAGKCDLYYPCIDRFLFRNASDASNFFLGDGSMEITVSHSEPPENNDCALSMAVIATFSTPNETIGSPYAPVTCTSNEYECPHERTCIPKSKICDYIIDCKDRSDESLCEGWYALDANESVTGGATLEAKGPTGNITFDQCQTLAIEQSLAATQREGYLVIFDHFVYNSDSKTCKVPVIPTSGSAGSYRVTGAIAKPSTIITTNTSRNDFILGDTTHVYLLQPENFKRCEGSVACNGNGHVRLAPGQTKRDGEECTCACKEGFSGEDCSGFTQLSLVGSLVVAFKGLHRGLEVIASVLADELETPVTKVRCAKDLIQVDAEHIGAICSVTAKRGGLSKSEEYRKWLLDPSNWASFNEDLVSEGHIKFDFITAVGLINTLTKVEGCKNVTSKTTDCPRINGTYGALHIVITAADHADKVSLELTTGPSNRRESHRRQVTCTPIKIRSSGACSTTSCDVTSSQLGIDMLNPQVAVRNVSYPARGTHADASKCTINTMTVEARARSGDVSTDATVALKNTAVDYSSFLIAGVLVFVVCFSLLMVLGTLCCCIGRRRLQKMREAFNVDSASGLLKIKLNELVRLKYFSTASVSRPTRIGAGLLVSSIIIAVLAIFLVLAYVTSDGRRSNFNLVYEEFSDNKCRQSTVSFLPRRMFAIPSNNNECEMMSVVGEAAGMVFASGHCIDGGSKVTLQIGNSDGRCRDAPRVEYFTNSCIPVKHVVPGDTRPAYVQFTCTDTATAAKRRATLESLSIATETRTSVSVQMAPIATISAAQMPLMTNKAMFNRGAPPGPYVAAAVGDYNNFDGDTDPLRLVLQTIATITAEPVASPVNVSTLESSLKNAMGQLPDANISAFKPTTSGYPVGFLFNAFGTSRESTEGGAQAFRYYGVRRTPFDFGAYLSDSTTLADGIGFSISLYLRATSSTQGFAFAVTDAFESMVTGKIYALDKMAELIKNGAGSGAWYNESYHIYSSLYVNGPGNTLIFTYADPKYDFAATDSRPNIKTMFGNADVQILLWDLNKINQRRLFNGQWHHVAIVFRVENDKPKALLIIDGKTSYSDEGWQQCVSRFPTPIANHATGRRTFQHASGDRISTGGMLVVGYFNGGVFNLQYESQEQPHTNYLVGGTPAMRAYADFQRTALLTIAIILFVCACFAALVILVALPGLVSNGSKAAKGLRFNTARKYYDVMLSDIHFTEYLPIRCYTAQRWSAGPGGKSKKHALSLGGVADMCEQFSQQFSDPTTHMRSFLYHTRLGNAKLGDKAHTQKLQPPTAEEWNGLVEKDAAEQLALLDEAPRGFLARLRSSFSKNKKSSNSNGVVSEREAEMTNDTLGTDQLLTGLPHSERKATLLRMDPYFMLRAKLLGEAGNNKGGVINDEDGGGGGDKELEIVDIDNTDAKEGLSDGLGHAQNALFGGENYQQMKMTSEGGGGSNNIAANITDSSVIKSMRASAAELLAPVILVIQSVYVWISSIGFPKGYDTTFANFFSFMSIDFAKAFDGIPPIVTPLLQLFLGLAAVSVLIYLLLNDNWLFDGSVIRYALRRDAVDCSDTSANATIALQSKDENDDGGVGGTLTTVGSMWLKEDGEVELDPRIPQPLHDAVKSAVPAGSLLTVQQLPVRSCRQADLLSGVSALTEIEQEALEKNDGKDCDSEVRDWAAAEHCSIEDSEGGALIVTKVEVKKACIGPDHVTLGARISHAPDNHSARQRPTGHNSRRTTTTVMPLVTAGIVCQRHPDVRLVPQTQSKTWPFDNRPLCGITQPNGELCGEDEGVMYVCGQRYEEDGVEKECTFALCSEHCRPTIVDAVLYATVFKTLRQVRLNGFVWLLCFVALIAANAVYTPFLKTAMMIVSCHPSYQCEFQRCWSDPDQKFIIAVFLCIVILAVLGLGYPMLLAVLIQQRRMTMKAFFEAPEYENRYLEAEEEDPKSENADTKKADKTDTKKEDVDHVSDAIESKKNKKDGEEEGAATPPTTPTRTVSMFEWTRFISTDTTALAQLYNTVHYKWLYLPPILLVAKILLLVPAVFIESRSVNQRIGIAVAEILYAAFIFLTETQISPVVVFSLRFASMHQLLILGLSNLGAIRQHEENKDYATGMIVSTCGFLAVNAVLIGVTVLYPTLEPLLRRRGIEARLNAFGYFHTQSVSVYLDPTKQRRQLSAVEAEKRRKSSHHVAAAHPTTTHNDNHQPNRNVVGGAQGGFGDQEGYDPNYAAAWSQPSEPPVMVPLQYPNSSDPSMVSGV